MYYAPEKNWLNDELLHADTFSGSSRGNVLYANLSAAPLRRPSVQAQTEARTSLISSRIPLPYVACCPDSASLLASDNARMASVKKSSRKGSKSERDIADHYLLHHKQEFGNSYLLCRYSADCVCGLALNDDGDRGKESSRMGTGVWALQKDLPNPHVAEKSLEKTALEGSSKAPASKIPHKLHGRTR